VLEELLIGLLIGIFLPLPFKNMIAKRFVYPKVLGYFENILAERRKQQGRKKGGESRARKLREGKKAETE
jgi:hypothetical protein